MTGRDGLAGWLLIGLLLAGGWACGDAPIQDELTHDGLTVDRVALEGTIAVADTMLGRPIKLEATERALYVADIYSTVPVHVFDQSTGAVIARLGAQGEGPGEFMRPDRVFVTDSVLWVSDLRLQRMTGYRTETLSESPDSAAVTISLPSDTRFFQFASLSDGGWLGIGSLGESRFSRLTAGGLEVERFGSLPGDAGVPVQARTQIYLSTIPPTDVNGRIPIAAALAGTLEICDLKGTCVSAETPYPYPADYELQSADGGAYMIDIPSTRRAYLDVDVTARAIYALFSGRSEAGFGARKAFGRFVHVFDWDGRLLEVWELDREAIALAIAPEEDVLYVAIHDPLPAVVAYRAPASVREP